MTCGCVPGAGELADSCDVGCVAATDPGAVDAPLAKGREDWHPALTATSMIKTAATGIRIRERNFTSTPQSCHAFLSRAMPDLVSAASGSMISVAASAAFLYGPHGGGVPIRMRKL